MATRVNKTGRHHNARGRFTRKSGSATRSSKNRPRNAKGRFTRRR